jgi:ABC-type microcin C transport system permease subunit YejB
MFQNEMIFILTCKMTTIIETFFSKKIKIETIYGLESFFIIKYKKTF